MFLHKASRSLAVPTDHFFRRLAGWAGALTGGVIVRLEPYVNTSSRLALVLLVACVTGLGVSVAAQSSRVEPIYTAGDLYDRCAAPGEGRRLCVAYLRGFSDGNRWLLRYQPVTLERIPHAVCVPNSESIEQAADLFVARFRDRRTELNPLSPFRAVSQALSGRYPCP